MGAGLAYLSFKHLLKALTKKKYGARNGVIPKTYIKKFLPTDPVIIEAGAYNGSDTLKMARLWPTATIFAFEPVPHLFAQLKENTAAYKNIQCFELALSNRQTSATLYVSSGASDGSSSLLKPKEHFIEHPDVEFCEEISVETISLNEWADSYGIRKIDFLWLDLQGHELTVLQAAGEILETTMAIHTEVNLKINYENCALYPELRCWLYSQGFKERYSAIVWNDGGNVLFTRL